jgi:branched-chain amino acid transport system ATP-binding protein
MSDQTKPLVIKSLNSWYGQAQALFDVSLHIGPGERVAILGRNGAGKTTLLQSIVGVQVRRSGAILFGEADLIKSKTGDVARAGICWVPDTRRIFSRLSVRDNIVVALSPRDAATAVDDAVDSFPALAPLLDRVGGALSGGEQQMLSIARALALKPDILLLDEPTEGLAPVVAKQLKQSLLQICESRAMGVILADSSLSFALDLCERAYMLDVGRVEFSGATPQIREVKQEWERYLIVGGDVPPGAITDSETSQSV